jgi:hypothetical protein
MSLYLARSEIKLENYAADGMRRLNVADCRLQRDQCLEKHLARHFPVARLDAS